MPTPGGLPKPGETWKRTSKLPHDGWREHVTVFKVIERGRGDYWPLRVQLLSIDGAPPDQYHRGPQLWVDAAYWHSRGELEFIRHGG